MTTEKKGLTLKGMQLLFKRFDKMNRGRVSLAEVSL